MALGMVVSGIAKAFRGQGQLWYRCAVVEGDFIYEPLVGIDRAAGEVEGGAHAGGTACRAAHGEDADVGGASRLVEGVGGVAGDGCNRADSTNVGGFDDDRITVISAPPHPEVGANGATEVREQLVALKHFDEA